MVRIEKDDLERLYLIELKSAKQIADIYGCHADTVLSRLSKFGIKRRSSSEGSRIRCTGRTSPNKGRKWTEAERERARKLWRSPEFRAKVIPKRSGANSTLWRGGTSDPANVRLARADWIKVRNECYIRDGGHCQDCGVKCLSRAEASARKLTSRIINCHHFIPRRHGGGDTLDNLVTLCVSCHHKRERRFSDALFG